MNLAQLEDLGFSFRVQRRHVCLRTNTLRRACALFDIRVLCFSVFAFNKAGRRPRRPGHGPGNAALPAPSSWLQFAFAAAENTVRSNRRWL